MTIRDACDPKSVDSARLLFREYSAAIGVDLCFQGFEAELAALPGCYAAPRGCILLAEEDSELAGCVALRPIDDRACEMKRLYLRPAFRGSGIGRKLAEAVIERATQIGYAVMRLDTLESMAAARGLYRALGFVECSPYYLNPLPGVVYMERMLRTGGTADSAAASAARGCETPEVGDRPNAPCGCSGA